MDDTAYAIARIKARIIHLNNEIEISKIFNRSASKYLIDIYKEEIAVLNQLKYILEN